MLSKDDKILINDLTVENDIVLNFQEKNWSFASVNRLLRSGAFCKSECTAAGSVTCYYLKERLLEEWHHFDQRIIDRAVSQWQQRLHRLFARIEDTLNIQFKRSV